jgi:hypothetical protein
MSDRIPWPEGKDFAFSIFDDCDLQTRDNASDVYAFLADLGLRFTKSVWMFHGSDAGQAVNPGETCTDAAYLDWVLQLQEQGFEIGLHNVTYHTSARAETAQGIEDFLKIFGGYPSVLTNHTGCREGIYWGDARLSGANRALYNLLLRNRNKGLYQGHVEGSPLFWGDLCREKIKYVRNFVFGDINTLRACPYMPYHDPQRPFVNYWFASSEGPDVSAFNATVSEPSQDRLASAGDACIMYTHLAKGFLQGRSIEPRFKTLMERLSRMNGWFVTVGALLDYLLEVRGRHELTPRDRRRLERRWLAHKIRVRGTT